jgi:hypothetical protein
MRELPSALLPEYQEYEVRVGWQSTIRLKQMVYSVPSRLIGHKVRAHVGETQIEVYCGRAVVVTLPRRHGRAGAVIDFRHVIADLVRKPGAFAKWRHREALFPTVAFRQAYDRFVAALGSGRGERDYLHLLNLAAETTQADVEAALGPLLKGGSTPTLEAIRRALPPTGFEPMSLVAPEASFSEYDGLLQTAPSEEEEELRHAS